MKNRTYSEPRLYVQIGDELPLSGQALLQLMQDVLARGKLFRFRARGMSMTPLIRDGDIITIDSLMSMPIRTGQIIAFLCPVSAKLVVHRVVARSSSGLIMQGDSMHGHNDGLVPFENLLARVIRIERSGKRICFGLGPERWLIAILSRLKLLVPLKKCLFILLKPVLRRRG